MDSVVAMQLSSAIAFHSKYGGVTLEICDRSAFGRYYIDLIFKRGCEYIPDDRINPSKSWFLGRSITYSFRKEDYFTIIDGLDTIQELCESAGIKIEFANIMGIYFDETALKYDLQSKLWDKVKISDKEKSTVTIEKFERLAKDVRWIYDKIEYTRNAYKHKLYSADFARLCEGTLTEKKAQEFTDCIELIRKLNRYSKKLSDFANDLTTCSDKFITDTYPKLKKIFHFD